MREMTAYLNFDGNCAVLAHNERALRFYRSLGFRDIGIARRHVWLSGEFHDEIYLEKLFD